jgi:hypothetical protein
MKQRNKGTKETSIIFAWISKSVKNLKVVMAEEQGERYQAERHDPEGREKTSSLQHSVPRNRRVKQFSV